MLIGCDTAVVIAPRVYVGEDTIVAPIEAPGEIVRLVDSLFDDPRIISFWDGGISINVGVIDHDLYRMVAFTDDYTWLCSLWEIAADSIPQKIWNAFHRSSYANYNISRTQIMHNESGIMYVLHLICKVCEDDPEICDPEVCDLNRVMCIKETGLVHCIITF
jgi:hypothetical protein